jgi:hypothetical protein
MLSSSFWNANLISQFTIVSFVGTSVVDLTDALSKGFTNHISGKSFTTVDTGFVGSSGGIGNGVGLIVNDSIITSSIYASMLSKGFSGIQLLPLCQAIGIACNITLLTATLTSTHTLLSGVGNVLPISISVSSSGMSLQIQGSTTVLVGEKFPDFCDAVSEGLVSAIQSISIGVVTITPSSPTAIPISPSSGSGLGIIT